MSLTVVLAFAGRPALARLCTEPLVQAAMYRAAYVLLARLCTEPLCIGPLLWGPMCAKPLRPPSAGATMCSAPYVQRAPYA